MYRSKNVSLEQIFQQQFNGCVLQVDLEYPKELRELGTYYPLAPDKLEIKKQMMPEYQSKIADFYNIPIDNFKKLVPNYFDKKIMCFIMKTCDFF